MARSSITPTGSSTSTSLPTTSLSAVTGWSAMHRAMAFISVLANLSRTRPRWRWGLGSNSDLASRACAARPHPRSASLPTTRPGRRVFWQSRKRQMNKSSMASLTLAALLVTWPLASTAAESGKVVLAVAGMEKQIYLPAKLCEQLGYFKAEGLDVELINTRAGGDAENELIAGEVQAVVGFYDHTIDIQSKGKSIISIVQLSRAPGEVELVAAKQAEVIKGPADFKGKTLGIRSEERRVG